MQNDDYPNNDYLPGTTPLEIPETEYSECALINCRVHNPVTNQSPVEQDVLVNTALGGDRAYLFVQTLRDAIYGHVHRAEILRRTNHTQHNLGAEWERTGRACAVKQIEWEKTRRQPRFDDPVQEINVMGYVSRTLLPNRAERFDENVVWATMNRTGLLLPLDTPLVNDNYLFVVMPYCNGGELLDHCGTFTEPQARHWFHRTLVGIETLQSLGLCHRDVSLENILVHDDNCYIMDYGMTIRIPYENVTNGQDYVPPETRGTRRLMIRGNVYGKVKYTPPETLAGVNPFDGHALDLFAAGVVLFILTVGGSGWDMATSANRAYAVVSCGHLADLLRCWEIGLSPECVDLLQNMMLARPQRRLSLAQIRAHPWMDGPTEAPPT